MKRGELIKRIAKIAKRKGTTAIFTEGGRHTHVQLGDRQTTIPRHNEINERQRHLEAPGRRGQVKVTAQATRSGKWWAVEVPEIPGLFTQARRLDQVVEAVADAASMLGHPQVEVEIVPQLSAGDLAAIETAKARRSQLREAEAAAAAASRDAVSRLRADGLPVRDVAVLMGISPQRVSVLA